MQAILKAVGQQDQASYSFPVDHVIKQFSFLTQQFRYATPTVAFEGREVDVLFRRDNVGINLWYEWAVLPQLFVEVDNQDGRKHPEVLHVDGGLFRSFGVEENVYPVHSKIQRSFFLVGILIHLTQSDKLREEVKTRIAEYAKFVEVNHDSLLEYAGAHFKGLE